MMWQNVAQCPDIGKDSRGKRPAAPTITLQLLLLCLSPSSFFFYHHHLPFSPASSSFVSSLAMLHHPGPNSVNEIRRKRVPRKGGAAPASGGNRGRTHACRGPQGATAGPPRTRRRPPAHNDRPGNTTRNPDMTANQSQSHDQAKQPRPWRRAGAVAAAAAQGYDGHASVPETP